MQHCLKKKKKKLNKNTTHITTDEEVVCSLIRVDKECLHFIFNLFLTNKSIFSPISTRKIEATSHSSFSSSTSAPCCASHRRPAVLRVVHKDGENKGRQFYTCSLPRETKCNFFEVKIISSLALCSLKNNLFFLCLILTYS